MAPRAAGVLLHPTSLPDDPGGLSAAASRFLAWAESAGLTVWQVLPLGPPGPGRSPYASFSAFAGDPRWFDGAAAPPDASAIEAFAEAERDWLPDWCLYAALRDAHRGAPWTRWEAPLRGRDPEALRRAASDLAEPIERHRRAQHAFHAGWSAVREEAARRGIALLGDVPIYPALDSADVWSHQDLFLLDDAGLPTEVAGVPPDYFSATGQLWGNPVYRWERHAETGFAWWCRRLAHLLTRHDALRLDHFRGFAGFWAVPAGEPTAAPGAWRPGPGIALFDAVARTLGRMPFVAEDLGVITHDVTTLRRTLALPGMRVLQFGLGGTESEHAPHRLERDAVVYTGTHDNDTSKGWFGSLDEGARRRVLDYVGGREDEIAWGMVRAAMTSVADAAIVPQQDLLGLGSEARMNVPGTAAGNWTWKAPADAFEPARAETLRRLVEAAGRARR